MRWTGTQEAGELENDVRAVSLQLQRFLSGSRRSDDLIAMVTRFVRRHVGRSVTDGNVGSRTSSATSGEIDPSSASSGDALLCGALSDWFRRLIVARVEEAPSARAAPTPPSVSAISACVTTSERVVSLAGGGGVPGAVSGGHDGDGRSTTPASTASSVASQLDDSGGDDESEQGVGLGDPVTASAGAADAAEPPHGVGVFGSDLWLQDGTYAELGDRDDAGPANGNSAPPAQSAGEVDYIGQGGGDAWWSHPVTVLGDWEVLVDPRYGAPYYYNRVTGESSWVQPSE